MIDLAKYGLHVIDYRAKWKHASRSWNKREWSDVKGLVVHQTAGGDSVDGLGRYHVQGPNHIGDGQGLPGIAYTFFVNKAGKIFQCNDIEAITWSHGDKSQPGDENKMFMSICFGGSFVADGWAGGHEQPTDIQKALMKQIWRALKAEFALCDLDLYGHYHFGKPTCPGDALKAMIDGFRASENVDNFDDPTFQQQLLAAVGAYTGAVDGKFGPKSVAALRSFQLTTGLPLTNGWNYQVTAEFIRTRRQLVEATRGRP